MEIEWEATGVYTPAGAGTTATNITETSPVIDDTEEPISHSLPWGSDYKVNLQSARKDQTRGVVRNIFSSLRGFGETKLKFLRGNNSYERGM